MKNDKSSRSILPIVCFLLVLLVFAGFAYGSQGPVLKWSFDGISDGIIKDESGNGNDGVVCGDPKLIDGRIGKALFFDGVDDWVEKINPKGLPCGGSDNWTINFWVMVDAFPKTDQWFAGWGRGLVDGWKGKGVSDRWINYNDSEKIEKFGRKLYFWAHGDGQVGIGEQIFSFGIWQMITATYDGEFIRVYNNGSLDTQRKRKLGDVKAEIVAIAKNLSPAGKGSCFKGKIDEFEIYDHALSEEDIYYLANPDSASLPCPANKQMVVDSELVLKWAKGANGQKAEVYFGDDYDEVYIANVYNKKCYKGTLEDTNLKLPDLEKGKTYFWRVDQVNQGKTTKGKVWRFTTKLADDAFVVKCHQGKVGLYEPVFADIYVADKEFENPFDTEKVYLDAIVKCPDGKEIVMPCFYYAGNAGDSMWGLRFAPRQIGKYSYQVKAYVDGKLWKTSYVKTFDAKKSKNDGFVHIDPDSFYNFVFDSGKLYRGVGCNFGWENFEFGKIYTDHWIFTNLKKMGCNFVCTSSMPWHIPLEWSKYGPGVYDLDAADKMDELIGLAKANGVYIKLSMHYYWECSTKADTFGNKMWDQNPYSLTNGGPCKEPGDFFTDPQAKKIYKNKLRYQVARWGYSPYLCVWELWKEVDNVVRYEESVTMDKLVSWHREMAKYLKSIDPYGRLITTSRGDFDGKLWDCKYIDFSQTHRYGPTYWFEHFFNTYENKYHKPHVMGECGYSWQGPRLHPYGKDYERTFHMSLWRGMFLPTPILPINWWWQWLDHRNEFFHLAPAAKFNAEILRRNKPIEKKQVEFKAAQNWNKTEVMALQAGSDVFAWMRNPAHYTIKKLTLRVKDIANGRYKVKYFDTNTGRYYNIHEVDVSDGKLETKFDYFLPDQDIACIIRLMKN